MKKIMALSCGSPNGNCETFIRAAAVGAEEFGIETEIIRAMSMKVLPFRKTRRKTMLIGSSKKRL